MLLLCLCALAGAYSLVIIPQLPSTSVFLATIFVSVAGLPFRSLRIASCFVIGVGVLGYAAASHRADQLDESLQGESVFFSAVILDFPSTDDDSTRFLVRPIDRQDLPRRIRLAWYQPDAMPVIGETWRLHVRLKRPRGYANPGGFDFEGWLFRQRIGATGYVDAGARSYRIHGERPGFISRIRARFVTRVESVLPQDDATAVLMAIGVGARHHIGRDQWDLYARTGTSHLMAISGLHIGLAASFAYLFCRALLAPFFSRRNLRDVAVVAAILAATAYATLSGFAVPARRSLIMAVFAGMVLLFRRRMRPSLLLVMSCLLIFVSDPIAVLAPGFKLSFSAVAILFLVVNRHVLSIRTRIGPWKIGHWPGTSLTAGYRLVHLQLALCAGLFPLTVLLFDRFAVLAPVINLLVLPVFNFLAVPLTLLGAVLDGPFVNAGSKVLTVAHGSISAILWLVAATGELGGASYRTRHLGPGFTLVAFLPLVFVLLPPGWPGRKLALIAIVAVLVDRPAPPPADCLDYHVLDVGQGLATVLRTRNHALLFDTGPSFPTGTDAAMLVVLPFLYGQGIDRLDRLIVSHGDLDHAGGAGSVVAGIEVDEVLVGEQLTDLSRPQEYCVAGRQWQWDGVGFSIVHPRHNAPWDRNNASCVMRVDVGSFRLLLTGDIESPAEKLLVYLGMVGATDVLTVPHHGSKTSSSKPFVDSTGAGLAIVSSGYGNRWGFPKQEVLARWQASGAGVVNTAMVGAVSQRICSESAPGPVRLQRLAVRRFWHELPGRRP